ncbi:MAG: integrase domain-containing protein [Proteobacteria bacterium]|nr:integrase domain-containing protein [Pseudomonadota bacterium]
MKHNKTNVPDVNYRSGLRYAIGRTVRYLEQGIGMPRRTFKPFQQSSPYIHNYKTLQRYTGIFNNFRDRVLVPANVNTIDKITTEHIETHFQNLIDRNYTEKTVRENASALNKFFRALNRDDLIAYINDSRRLWVSLAVPSCRTIPFGFPDKVIGFMRDPYKSGAIIQKETGARTGDIRKVVESVLSNPSSSIIYILKSKGGRDRQIDFSDRPNELEAIRQAVYTIDKHFSETKTTWSEFIREYTREVKRAAVKAGEIYCGPHAFRANYAEGRYETMIGDSDDREKEKAVLKTITEELGHSRLSMVKYYIPTFRRD